MGVRYLNKGVILDEKRLRGLGRLETVMITLATVDLKTIHEIYKELKKDYSQNGERSVYFLATCQYLDPDLDLDIAMKMRPYGGLIGIDNTSLDKYFKSYKNLMLHAILHDASGFVFEYSEKRPGYSYVLHCPVTNEYLGHETGLVFCLYEKTFKSNLFSFLEC